MTDSNATSGYAPHGSEDRAIVRPGGADFAPAHFGHDGAFLPGPAFGEERPHGPSVGAYLTFLVRHKWLALSVFVLLAGGTIPLVWVLIVPEFRASAIVRVAPVVNRVLYKYEENGMLPLYNSYLNTQVSVIRSPNVLQRVIELPEVKATAWFQEKTGSLFRAPRPPLQRLTKTLNVAPRRGTELIDVSLDTRQPADAKLIVDAVSDQYIRVVKEREQASESERMALLYNSAEALQTVIGSLTSQRNRVSANLGTDDPGQYRDRIVTYLSTLEERTAELRRRRAELEWQLGRQTGDDTPEEVEDGAEPDEQDVRYVDDPEWRQLRRMVSDAEHNLKLLRDRYGEQHPDIKTALANIAYDRELLVRRETELDDPAAVPVLALSRPGVNAGMALPVVTREGLEEAIANIDNSLTLLSEDHEKQRRKVAAAGKSAGELADIDLAIRFKRDELSTVQERLKVLSMESKVSGRISIAARALLPTEPYRDRRLLLTIMAFLGSLGAGVGAALMRGMLDPSVRQVGDVTTAVRAPFLGYLPKVRFESELWEETPEALCESMRMIRTALLERLSQSGGSTVLVTSSGAQAGKTSTAILLAKSLSQLGKRVLLVDADLRRPSLTKRLGIETSVGLSEVLAGAAGHEQAVVREFFPHVDVLPTSPDTPNHDPELIANGVFSASLERWKREYDFVLLDSPPILPVADARIMAAQVDGAILTLRASHCRKQDVVGAATLLAVSGCTPLGTVLVGAEDNSFGYSGNYGYGSYAYSPAVLSSS